ncbi:hypothetical protein [Paraburkholderia sp. 2C]
MNKPIIHYIALRTSVCVAIALAASTLAGCANFHGQPNGPGDCVGPPGFCVPYFGANAIVPGAQPARAYAAFHRLPQAARQPVDA